MDDDTLLALLLDTHYEFLSQQAAFDDVLCYAQEAREKTEAPITWYCQDWDEQGYMDNMSDLQLMLNELAIEDKFTLEMIGVPCEST